MNAVRRLLGAFDAFQQQHAALAFPLAVVKKFGDDQAGQLAALIAYYGFFALFPLLLVLTTVVGIAFRHNPALQHHVLNTTLSDFPMLRNTLKLGVLSGNGVGLIIGLIGTFFGARGVANAAQYAFNSVWEVPFQHRPGFPWNWLRSLAMMLVVGVGVLVTTTLAGVGAGSGGHLMLRVAAIGVSLALNVLLFWLGFRLATSKVVPTRDLLLGAALAAVFWQLLQMAGGYLISHQLSHATALYGVFFGIVLGLLSWLYLQAQLTIYAVEVDVVRTRHLWPRSFFPPPLTEADERAYTAYGEVEKRRPEQRIDVDFPGDKVR